MEDRAKAESFTTFLEAEQRRKSIAQTQSAPGPTPLSLLLKVADAPQRQMQVTELMGASGMAFTTFADALKSLGDSGYVTFSGAPSGEIASLTTLGEGVVCLVRQR